MNTIKFLIVFSIVLLSTDLIYYQVVNGQNNETAKARVDKLIEDTISDNATDQAYRAELIKRMQNTTCLEQAIQLTKQEGYAEFNPDYFTTPELVDMFKQCVRDGEIK